MESICDKGGHSGSLGGSIDNSGIKALTMIQLLIIYRYNKANAIHSYKRITHQHSNTFRVLFFFFYDSIHKFLCAPVITHTTNVSTLPVWFRCAFLVWIARCNIIQ